MTKTSKSPYDRRTEDSRNKIDGNRASYTIDKVYKSNFGEFLYFINRHGYYHILYPQKDHYLRRYVIQDFLLTVDDKLQAVGNRGVFDTKEQCLEAFKEDMRRAEDAENN